ncbi:MAG: HlyD family efflux transporter periplasmic adaptor subunit, partial [Acidobacteria bacterium]|nr:HlyD family efflux transporter periplasmic adaptor subunit [Acidobacteriota bacterium]
SRQLFSKTLRSLEADRGRRLHGWLAGVLVLLLAWGAWFFFGSMAVFAVSREGRLEVAGAAHPVAALTAGRIAAVDVTLGQTVAAGDALVELDPGALPDRRRRQLERLEALGRRRAALEKELTGARSSLAGTAEERRAGLAEAAARRREAEAAADQAQAEVERLEELTEAGLVSDVDLERARSYAAQQRAGAEALASALERRRSELDRGREEAQARVQRLENDLAALAEEAAAAQAERSGLDQELATRTLRAPEAGVVGELAELTPGSAVTAGQVLAAVVPPGETHAVAWFAPADALGRIRPGQRARILLTGFPPLRYGALEARVERVGTESSTVGGASRVRVELRLDPSAARSGIPLEHGLPATAEIEVERVSPAGYLFRTASHRGGSP